MMLQKILTWLFYTLFFFTPLFFTQYNHELFEYNKMMLVYGLTVVIATVWLLKMLFAKKPILKSTPLDIPIILFFISQFLSTIFSIDPHTSWWGYYSRSNGGLFSVISYILLYYALVSNFEVEDGIRFLKTMLFGGLLVALYAIPEHFGFSPSCLLLVNEFTASCWVQDVQARVFATLGQPNWLAAYLGMLIFPGIYFYLTSKRTIKTNPYLLPLLLIYLAFTFTFSRGGALGLIAGIVVFGVLFFGEQLMHKSKNSLVVRKQTIMFVVLLGGFIFFNIYFGSALTNFKLEKFSAPPRPALVGSGGGTQLENGGTESGQIRLIVWQGALDVFKHYPIFGSGVETFAYSYYQFRPAAHNLVSEWDFLYNKAHNEYLNYLATTGAVGLGTYLLLIGSFIVWCIKYLVSSIKKGQLTTNDQLLTTSLLAGYVSFLVQNIFSFSVVIIAVLFFLFPALAFLVSGAGNEATRPDKKFLFSLPHLLSGLISSPLRNISLMIYKRKIYSKVVAVIIVLFGLYFLLVLVRYWQADTHYKLGSDYEDSGDIAKSYQELIRAVNLNRGEPLYRSDLGFITAAAAVGYLDKDATLSAQLKEDAVAQTDLALSISPANVSLWRTAIRAYYQLASIDASYEQRTLDTLDQTIALAPTDPKLYYNKGLILDNAKKYPEAVEALNQTLKLKPNYREAWLTLGSVYTEMKEKEKAADAFNAVLKMIPNDPDALKGLDEVQKTK